MKEKPRIINGAQPEAGLQYHAWPKPEEHLWTSWMLNTSREGATPPTEHRTCLHPACHAVEVRTTK